MGAEDEDFLIKVYLMLLSDFFTYLIFSINIKFLSFKTVFSIDC